MNDERLEKELKKCFQHKYIMDEQIKSRINSKLYERQDKTEGFLLYFIQITALILSIIILIIAFIINGGLAIPLILISHAVICSLISVAFALTYKHKHYIYVEEKII